MGVHVQGEVGGTLTLDALLGNLGTLSDSRLMYSLKIYGRQILAGLREEKQK